MRDLRALPKAHLHLHIEGSARRSTIAEFAARTGRGYAPPASYPYRDFSVFQAAYDEMTSYISTPEDLARICRELVEDDANQGAFYTEPIILPSFYQERFGMSELEIFDLMREAFFEAGEQCGIEVGIAIAGIFTLPIEATEAEARFAAEQSDRGVVAFNLCATEPGFGYERWIRPCDIARDAGLDVVVHAGEFGPASAIEAAISVLNADRLSHGVRAVDDPSVFALLAERGLVCDVAPTSNVVLGLYRELREVPILQFLDAGIPFTLNADDPLFSVSGVGDEYVVVRDTFGLSDEEMAGIARTSVAASHSSPATKQRALDAIDTWLRTPA
ncbi:MAG TPA: adenosine deaminase [Thermomicrobiales bacterium]|jgi:adenosine deaminase|nr:adenosine deaminase [Thermomicrobiales bacterium]